MIDKVYISTRNEYFSKMYEHYDEINKLKNDLKHLRQRYMKEKAKFKNHEKVFRKGDKKEYYVCRIDMFEFGFKIHYSITDKKIKGYVRTRDIVYNYVDEKDLMSLKGLK